MEKTDQGSIDEDTKEQVSGKMKFCWGYAGSNARPPSRQLGAVHPGHTGMPNFLYVRKHPILLKIYNSI